MSQLLSDYDFALPKERIALYPATPRESAKMMVLQNSNIDDKNIADFVSYLNPNDLVIFNNTKVIRASLTGKRGDAKISLNLLKPNGTLRWQAFAKPAKKLSIDDVITFADDFSAIVKSKIGGEIELEFTCDISNFYSLLEKYGHMPLPPYIAKQREYSKNDDTDYQPVFAKIDGAVASPTASLHFTPEILSQIPNKEFVTLHVGAGTFLPVTTDDVSEHQMHSEYGEVSPEIVQKINDTKQNGGRIFAIGTTTLRILESAARSGELQPFKGDTDIFITPPYNFKVVDCLMTNFHLPKSTLLMLVSAFSGMQEIANAYQHAIDNDYRFFSYGDACLLLK